MLFAWILASVCIVGVIALVFTIWRGRKMGDSKNISPIVYVTAWNELYKCFGERMQQEELDLMDSVLQGVELDMQEESILRQFPHLVP